MSSASLTDNALIAILENSEAVLPARQRASAAPSLRLISRGSRVIRLLRPPDGSNGRSVVVKERPCVGRTAEQKALAAAETHQEYQALRSACIRLGCDTTADSHHRVPRPLLSIPEHGLLCMEWCEGRQLRSILRGAVLRPWKWTSASCTLERCGKWLREFVLAQPHEAAVRPKPNTGRNGVIRNPNYIYALIGLQGVELAEALVGNAERRLEVFGIDGRRASHIVKVMRDRCYVSGVLDAPTVPVHGKFTAQDILVTPTAISVVDFEYCGTGVPFLDLAFLVYELHLVNRWNPITGDRVAAQWRDAFLSAYGNVDLKVLECFVAYFMINSLKRRGGMAGCVARRYASRWLSNWVHEATQ